MQDNEKRNIVKLPSVFCSEDLLSKVGGNVFQLVRIAANRALELDSGKPSLISNFSSDKVTTIALEEIVQGKVVLKSKKTKEDKVKEIKNTDVKLDLVRK